MGTWAMWTHLDQNEIQVGTKSSLSVRTVPASKKCHEHSSRLATRQSHGKIWRAADSKLKQ